MSVACPFPPEPAADRKAVEYIRCIACSRQHLFCKSTGRLFSERTDAPRRPGDRSSHDPTPRWWDGPRWVKAASTAAHKEAAPSSGKDMGPRMLPLGQLGN